MKSSIRRRRRGRAPADLCVDCDLGNEHVVFLTSAPDFGRIVPCSPESLARGRKITHASHVLSILNGRDCCLEDGGVSCEYGRRDVSADKIDS